MFRRQILQDGHVRRVTGLSPFTSRKTQLVEQDFPELWWRVYVELLSRHIVYLPDQLFQLAVQALGQSLEDGRVYLHAPPLHVCQHLYQRQLYLTIEVLQSVLAEQRLKDQGELKGYVGILGGIGRRRFDRHFVEAFLLSSLACNVLVGGHLVVEVLKRQVVQIVGPPGRVEQVGGYHRVEGQPSQLSAFAGEDDHIVFDVLAVLCNLRVFQDREES